MLPRVELDHDPTSALFDDTVRYLIVNADDFGRSPGINEGTLRAHSHGIVTSASLMVRWPSAPEAVTGAASFPRLGLGLHIDLGEWAWNCGEWKPLYEVVPTDSSSAVGDEIQRQLESFCTLVGRPPTHMDSHQHVHQQEPVRTLIVEVARHWKIPLRRFEPRVNYRGEFYGQSSDGAPLPDAISAPSLVNLLNSLPAGITEVCCHPGFDEELPGMYSRERRREVATLCDRRVLEAVAQLKIRLSSFADLFPAPVERSHRNSFSRVTHTAAGGSQ